MNLKNSKMSTVLIAEDDDDDFFLINRKFHSHYPEAILRRVLNGEELMGYLRTNELPVMIILDLNMPRVDGREVMKVMKKDEDLKDIPVVVLTTSSSDVDRKFVSEQGAVFLTKPYKVSSYSDLMELLRQYIE